MIHTRELMRWGRDAYEFRPAEIVWATPAQTRNELGQHSGLCLGCPTFKEETRLLQSALDRLRSRADLLAEMQGLDGILGDWSLPGAHTECAAYEMARTVCRRAERGVVRFIEEGNEIKPEILAYLDRLSDLIWLFGRLIELDAGVDASLRDETKSGPRWSRAW